GRVAVAELLVLAEDLVLQPAPGLGPGQRVGEDAEGDPDEEQAAVPALVRLAALDPVGCFAEVADRRAERFLDVLVARDPGRDAGHPAVADQLVVDVTGGGEGATQVLAQLLVLDRSLHVGLGVFEPVFRLGHGRRPFIRLRLELSTLGALRAKQKRRPGAPRRGRPAGASAPASRRGPAKRTR